MDKVINDGIQIIDILKTLHRLVPFYLSVEGIKTQIKPISISRLGIFTPIPIHLISECDVVRKITLTYNNKKLEFQFNSTPTKHRYIEHFKPINLIISEASREDIDRIKVENDDDETLHLTQIINCNNIHKLLAFESAKIDSVIKKYQSLLHNKFSTAIITLTAKQDARLRLLNKHDKPIFIPNISENINPNFEFLSYEEYSKKIVMPGLIDDRFKSEICIVIKYKEYIPIGYLQVNHKDILPAPSFDFVKAITNRLSKELIDTGYFRESTEQCNIVDLSQNGLSFLFSQSTFFIKSFAIGEFLIFDLQIGQKRISIKAVIRNIKNMESKFRMGVQFIDLNQEASSTISNYLEKSKTNASDEITKNEIVIG